MALTKDQWFEKLKGLVPGWVFEKDPHNVAIYKGMAAVLQQAQVDYEAHQQQTFIDSAVDEILDVHGVERNKERINGETDPPYRARIKLINNSSDCISLKAIVDTLLLKGESQIIEHYSQENFLNRNGYLNRNIIDFDVLYNAFTILVSKQIPDPLLFCDREYFCNREDTIGTNESNIELFEGIVEAVNKEKAFGEVYRLIERPTED